MTFVTVRTKADTKLVRKGLEDLAAEIPRIGRQQIFRVVTKAKGRLNKPGKRVAYPIPWDNMRQKVKVIILLKATNNMPYRRKGDYQKGYAVVKLEEGYELVNELDKAIYIGGDAQGKGQSRIFKGRYPIMRVVVDEEVAKLPSAVVAHIEIVAREKGFKTP